MEIRIDTARDSKEEIQKVIRLLQELMESQAISNSSGAILSSGAIGNTSQDSTSPMADLFGFDTPSASSLPNSTANPQTTTNAQSTAITQNNNNNQESGLMFMDISGMNQTTESTSNSNSVIIDQINDEGKQNSDSMDGTKLYLDVGKGKFIPIDEATRETPKEVEKLKRRFDITQFDTY